MTRVLAFSDVHHSRAKAAALVSASKDADLVIGAGDFCNMRTALPDAMAMFAGITQPFALVPGNAESADELAAAAHAGWRVMHGTGLTLSGLHLFGLGYGVPTTPFGDWSCDLSEPQAAALLSACTSADILITHSPPKGVADVTANGASVGSTAVRAAIERIQPKLAVCGHIHDSWGQEGRIGQTRVVNLGPTPNWFEI